jgi:hypothetical protein
MWIAVIMALILLAVSPLVASADGVPQMPNVFYGSVDVRATASGSNSEAPVGTVVSAKVNGVEVGSTTVAEEGVYGPPGQQLLIQGDIADGAEIKFYVNGNLADQTGNFHSYTVTELDLTAYVPDMIPTPTVTPTSNVTPTPTVTPTSNVTPTPTVTATSNVTPTPTVAATATTMPTSASQTLTMKFGDSDETDGYTFSINDDGSINQDITTSSVDSSINIHIQTGTKLLDSSGKPLSEIGANVAASAPSVDGYSLIKAFEFDPDGAQFSPAIEIILKYNPDDVPEGQIPAIAYFNDATGECTIITNATIDTEDGTITFLAYHFTTFAVLIQSTGAHAAISGGAPTWVWILLVILALSLILTIWLVTQRRHKAQNNSKTKKYTR